METKKLEWIINEFKLKGVISKVEKGQTKQGYPFYKVLIEAVGRYTDYIPMTGYGDFMIPKVGSSVFVIGRIRSKEFDLKYSPELIMEGIYEIREA
jgi:hypothetical protein